MVETWTSIHRQMVWLFFIGSICLSVWKVLCIPLKKPSRLLERIERTEQLLLKGCGNVSEEDADFDDNDSEDVYIEGKYEIDVKHLRVDDYLEDE